MNKSVYFLFLATCFSTHLMLYSSNYRQIFVNNTPHALKIKAIYGTVFCKDDEFELQKFRYHVIDTAYCTLEKIEIDSQDGKYHYTYEKKHSGDRTFFIRMGTILEKTPYHVDVAYNDRYAPKK